MKGSEKFWSIIGIIFMIYGNYLCFFTDFVPKDNAHGMPLAIGMMIFLADLALIVVIIGVFFTQILPKFNNWLDEKF